MLACGPGAVLSHLSAAALWRLLRDNRVKIDVTVPGRSRRGSGDIVVHRVRRLHTEADRARDAALQRAGYRVLRVTGRRLQDDPAGIAADLRELLR